MSNGDSFRPFEITECGGRLQTARPVARTGRAPGAISRQPVRRRARNTMSSTWCEAAEAAPGGRGLLS